MPTADTRGVAVERSSASVAGSRRDDTNRHFRDVFSTYRSIRDLDLAAVRLVSGVFASAGAQARPFRLLDVGTGTGRYLDQVSEHLSATLAADICPIGLDRSPAMLGQARRLNGCPSLGASHLVGAVETLPFRAGSCDAITSFNAVHHFDLARFASEAARVLTPSGLLVLYTRTAAQNRSTIWGRYFPERGGIHLSAVGLGAVRAMSRGGDVMASEGGAARRLAGRRGFVRRIHDERSVRYGVHRAGCIEGLALILFI